MTTYLDTIAGYICASGSAGILATISAVPIVAGVAAYVTRMGSQAKIDKLEGELSLLNLKADELPNQKADLLN